mgnify:FL=1
MAIFEAKYCSLCETKLGLFGTQKLANGQLCKDCANKLSPLMSGIKRKTLGEIQSHLHYREENQKKMESFAPDQVFGNDKKIYVDTKQELFCISRSDYRKANADLISFRQIQGIDVHIEEEKEEIFNQNEEGKAISFDPKKYSYEYKFLVEIDVDSPWFSSIKADLSDGNHPTEAWNDLFRKYEEELRTLRKVLCGTEMGDPLWEVVKEEESSEEEKDIWVCGKCGRENTGKFCAHCGLKRPIYKCTVCGYELQSRELLPRYCINCGAKMNQY